MMMKRRRTTRTPILYPSFFFLLSLLSTLTTLYAKEEDVAFQPTIKDTFDADLFAPCPEIKVISPSAFPKPTHLFQDEAIVPLVRPVLGRHRPDKNAVLAYAEGYRLSDYMMFVETLQATGFTGDVVLAIAEERIIKPNVREYLSAFVLQNDSDDDDNKMHVVLYQHSLQCEDRDGKTGRNQIKSGETDSFQMCQLGHVYGYANNGTSVPDPRAGRVVATLRYEWYWIWSLQYHSHQWLMLMDARDTYFQTNPFGTVPQRQSLPTTAPGLLYFFGENAQATRLGMSRKNSQWLKNGYGPYVMNVLAKKPTICSGGTMGEQVALETYLRAMVNEHDECDIKMTGSDQGFHNYLYYSSKLHNAATIEKIVVWEQGRGMINNVGAMRTQPLTEWGVYEGQSTTNVYQWDGVSLSPVVHQWDRDAELHKTMKQKHRVWEQTWKRQQQSGITKTT